MTACSATRVLTDGRQATPLSSLLLPVATQRPGVRYAWRGPSQLIVDEAGAAGAHPLTGYFFRQTRFLRHLELRVMNERPHLCSIAEIAPNVLELTYIHPEVTKGGGGGSGSGGSAAQAGLLSRNLDICVRYEVHPASLDVSLRVTSRWQDSLELELAWLLGADYASTDEAQFDKREQEAPVEVVPVKNGVVFRYTHPDLPFETRVVGSGAAWRHDADRLRASVTLSRQAVTEFGLRIEAVDALDPLDAAGAARREARLERWYAGVARFHAPGESPLVECANRASVDLGSFALLEGPEQEWLTPGAGVPLYQTLWGRDALTTSWQAGLLDGGVMLGDVLTRLARLQGRTTDAGRDEQPGRIINQAKTDPLSRLGQSGFDRNYADVASPFMFIIGLGYRYALTGDRDALAMHYDAAIRVLEWADTHGDRDGDGYIEYLTVSQNGPRHQGWKDSENAIVDEAGRQVEPPIAPCEIQGYWHVALQYMAVLSAVMGETERGLELWRQARALKERFNRDFWMEDDGFIAFGLDANKQPIRARTSNAGQCLATGIVEHDNVARLVRGLFEPDLFSGWGIRTLSTTNPAYNPLDYHLGAVWPVENATILFGLRRYGFDDRAEQLTRALYDLARLWPQSRTPECVGGYARDELAHPGAYPRANRPQAWNQSVWPVVMQCLLGLVPFAPMRLLLVDPVLPPWLPELSVRGLRVGDATVTLNFRRAADGASHHEIVEQTGELRIIRQPWLESFSADPWERAHGLFASLAAR